MKDFVYPRDRTLTAVTLTIGVAFWSGVVVAVTHWGGPRVLGGILGVALIAVITAFVAYVFVKSAVIAHWRGNAIEVAEDQLPDLHNQLAKCCEILGITTRPTMFIQNGNGVLNAFATGSWAASTSSCCPASWTRWRGRGPVLDRPFGRRPILGRRFARRVPTSVGVRHGILDVVP